MRGVGRRPWHAHDACGGKSDDVGRGCAGRQLHAVDVRSGDEEFAACHLGVVAEHDVKFHEDSKWDRLVLAISLVYDHSDVYGHTQGTDAGESSLPGHPCDAETVDLDDGNESELAGHHIAATELVQMLSNEPTWAPNRKDRPGLWLAVGY